MKGIEMNMHIEQVQNQNKIIIKIYKMSKRKRSQMDIFFEKHLIFLVKHSIIFSVLNT